jgi:hypothetical protein
MENIIKVGTKVKYRGCFGMDEPTIVKVLHIQRSEYKRCKYGDGVDSVPFSEREYCVFSLDNGHWCYGEQIDAVV